MRQFDAWYTASRMTGARWAYVTGSDSTVRAQFTEYAQEHRGIDFPALWSEFCQETQNHYGALCGM